MKNRTENCIIFLNYNIICTVLLCVHGVRRIRYYIGVVSAPLAVVKTSKQKDVVVHVHAHVAVC